MVESLGVQPQRTCGRDCLPGIGPSRREHIFQWGFAIFTRPVRAGCPECDAPPSRFILGKNGRRFPEKGRTPAILGGPYRGKKLVRFRLILRCSEQDV